MRRPLIAFATFEAAVRSLYSVLDSPTETALRLPSGEDQPGTVFRFPAAVNQVLLIGDLHPSKDTLTNLAKLLELVYPDLEGGTLGLAILGDFTHPGEGDLTDMAPSIELVTEWLAPLKVTYPTQVTLIRGDHESVGSPYGIDFGKITDYLSSSLVANNPQLWASGLVTMVAPNRPEFVDRLGEPLGLFDMTERAERFCFQNRRMLTEEYRGKWYDFIEYDEAQKQLRFSNDLNPQDQRTLFLTFKDATVQLLWPDPVTGQLLPCSLSVNQSSLWGAEIRARGGDELVRFVQQEVYDRLPMFACGQNFICNHAAPPLPLPGETVEPSICSSTDIASLKPRKHRATFKEPWFRTIFGRPFRNKVRAYNQQTIKDLLSLMGLPITGFYVVGHTRVDHFVAEYPLDEAADYEVLNDSVIKLYQAPPYNFIIDSQGPAPAGLLLENRIPLTPEQVSTSWRVIGA